MDIKISKIKLRRGTNNQRKSVILDQGEIVYTTDTQRLYVGNGVSLGGVSPTTRVHTPLNNTASLLTLNAETGDIVVANNKLYQLTGNDPTNIYHWTDISLKVSSPVKYDSNNTLTIGASSISAVNLDATTITNGLKIQNNLLQLNYDTRSFQISSNKLVINNSGINQNDISSTTFTNGISGGSGSPVGLQINPSQFYIQSNTLSLCSTSVILGTNNQTISSSSGIIGVVTNSIDYNFIPSYSFNNGISGGSGQQITLNANPELFYFDGTGALRFSIYDTLTGNSSLNSSNTLSSIFNGNPSQLIDGAYPNAPITEFEALSSNGTTSTTIVLSSAGFITFENTVTTKTGKKATRFAIPIFSY